MIELTLAIYTLALPSMQQGADRAWDDPAELTAARGCQVQFTQVEQRGFPSPFHRAVSNC